MRPRLPSFRSLSARTGKVVARHPPLAGGSGRGAVRGGPPAASAVGGRRFGSLRRRTAALARGGPLRPAAPATSPTRGEGCISTSVPCPPHLPLRHSQLSTLPFAAFGIAPGASARFARRPHPPLRGTFSQQAGRREASLPLPRVSSPAVRREKVPEGRMRAAPQERKRRRRRPPAHPKTWRVHQSMNKIDP